jgi:hypothetical protein
MKKGVIIAIIIAVIILGLVLYYIFSYKKSTSETPSQITQPSVTLQPELPKTDAVCKTIIEPSYYTFDTTKTYLGKDLMRIEHFALTSDIITDPSLIDPNKFYYKGTLNTSSTTTPAKYGGIPCVEFPTVIYKPVL